MLPVTDIFIDSFIVKRRSFLDQLDVDPVADLRKLANSVGMAEIAILPIGNNKFKISSPDYHIDAVTNFIKIMSNTYFTLNCVDVTRDFAGSFYKQEIKEHLMKTGDFDEQCFIVNVNHNTIIKSNSDAHTCLQYWNGTNQRCKMYLKMPEILQSKSIRSAVGNRWLSWVVKNNRLGKARDASVNRGLTRIEVSYYIDAILPSLISGVTQHLRSELVYSTPHSAMWNAYCDCFKHTLIISDPQFGANTNHIKDSKSFPPGRALLVYSFNRKTKDISGKFIEKWNSISRHVIQRQTLSSNLPVDIIEVCNYRKVSSLEKPHTHIQVHITRNKYLKLEDAPLYLTKDHIPFNVKSYNEEENRILLTQAGMISHENCTVSLPARRHSKFSKTANHLVLLAPDEEIETNKISLKVTDTTPENDNKNLKELKIMDLPVGIYDVKQITTRKSPFGRFIISIGYKDTISQVTSNKFLDKSIPAGGLSALEGNLTVAKLHIIGKKRDHNRHLVVNAEIVI